MTQLGFNLDTPVTVAELTRRIKAALEQGFGDVWVQGEITGLRVPSSGHLYFSLKDKDAQIRVVFFRSGSRFLKFKPEDGMEVILRGRLTVYEARGEYQIIAEFMEQKGLGALQLAFLQLKDKLEKEGLFDPSRKRPLPPYPKSVGVVTSPTGAAVRDILNIMGRRAPGVRVVIAPSSVQGETAPLELVRGLRDLNELGGLDAIILARGGGSIEDLAAFNTEAVARAVFSSGTPVISAVGHETDFTIADFVADLRAPTPSAAAELVATSERRLRERLTQTQGRLSFSIAHGLRHLRNRLNAETRAICDPRKVVQERTIRLDDVRGRMLSAQRAALVRRAERAQATARLLASFEPLAPLSRGFALVQRYPGKEIVTSVSALSPGDRLRLRFKDGEAGCEVTE